MWVKAFDTCKSSDSLDDFIAADEIPEGCIIAAACKDECATNLSATAKQWFSDMGSKEVWNLEYRHGFAFIGVSGRNEASEIRAKDGQDEVTITKVFTRKVDFSENL